MEEFYYDVITFLGNLNPFVKVLIVGLLAILLILSAIKLVKIHVNPKKAVFKIGQFLVFAILLALTIFVCINVF